MACGAYGWASRLAVQEGGTLDVSGKPFHFSRESIQYRQDIRVRDVITGDRGTQSNQLKNGLTFTLGSIWLEPSPAILDTMLKLILWGTPAATVYDFGDTPIAFMIAKDVDSDLYDYTDCYVNRAVFTGSGNGQISLRLDIVGGAEDDLATWPTFTDAVGDGIDDQPYGFEESVLTLDSKVIDMFQFQLTINNHLTPKIVNSATPSGWCPAKKRSVNLSVVVPFATADELGLYNATARSEIAGSIVCTNSTVSTDFDFPNMKNSPRTPTVQNQGEIPHQMNFILSQDSSDTEMTVTNDSTV